MAASPPNLGVTVTYGNAEFSRDAIERLPELRGDLELDTGLLHPQMGTLAAAILESIRVRDTHLPARIFAFLDDALSKPGAISEIENAIAISFVEARQLRTSHIGMFLLETMPERIRRIVIEQEARGGAQ